MGDRVAVMKDGLLQQVDTPLRLYDSPANLFVAGFIGSPAMNLLEGKFNEAGADINGHTLPVPVTAAEKAKHSGSITVGIRPEAFKVSDAKEGIPVTVTVVEELGADAYLFGITDDAAGDEAITAGTNVVVRVEARRQFEKGTTVHVTADPQKMHVFATETGERIGSAG
jgi:multiple sugar transport system ATP-binding protein